MEYISNVYVINMDKSTERLKRMESQLEIIGKPFTRIRGVEGNKLTTKEVANYTTVFCNTFCTYSMIGCFLSHKKCWEKMVENGDEYAMILEDDALLVPTFQKDIKDTLNELITNGNWDFLYVGCFGACEKDQKYDFISYLQKISTLRIFNSKKICNNKYSFIPESPIGFHCYILTQDCARKMLKLFDKVNYHVDVAFMLENKNFNTYACKKNLAYQFSTSKHSTQTEEFPVILNSVLDSVKCSKGISYSYYFSSPIISLGKFNVTIFLIIFITIVSITPYPYNLLILLYFIPELYHGNYSYILFWIMCILTIIYGKKLFIKE